jgi:hypothetical protein
MPLITTIHDLAADADAVRRGRYGVIETVAGRFHCLRLRPWPKLVSWPELIPGGERLSRRLPGARCLLYYNQPRRFPNFLALRFVVSSPDAGLATSRRALAVLDEIARLKRTDALLCDAFNSRISDRLLRRWGWEPHTLSRWHRNFIKRFYGVYEPAAAGDIRAKADDPQAHCVSMS